MRSRRPSSSRRVWRQALACRTTAVASSRRLVHGVRARVQVAARHGGVGERRAGRRVASASAADSATSPARCSGDAEAATTIEAREPRPQPRGGAVVDVRERAGVAACGTARPGRPPSRRPRCGRARPGRGPPVARRPGRRPPRTRPTRRRRGPQRRRRRPSATALRRGRRRAGRGRGPGRSAGRRSRRPAAPSRRRPPPRRSAPRPRRSPAARSGRGGGRARRARRPAFEDRGDAGVRRDPARRAELLVHGGAEQRVAEREPARAALLCDRRGDGLLEQAERGGDVVVGGGRERGDRRSRRRWPRPGRAPHDNPRAGGAPAR